MLIFLVMHMGHVIQRIREAPLFPKSTPSSTKFIYNAMHAADESCKLATVSVSPWTKPMLSKMHMGHF